MSSFLAKKCGYFVAFGTFCGMFWTKLVNYAKYGIISAEKSAKLGKNQ